ncbi:intracellular protein transport protein USO1 [Reticulomyxa filosa]|uniref:Intracellular protein transport protein USO1 n=1 Tax=Reticulomyxa filosa TaxID=46433 RepID=X6NKE3_RETFI|nr:intracellular protein transport protein USO1 [Reticulomyxa filosa]|eukprot:ETO25832.1 intracellular protein transport protein USO1 [Reticulomyxa filosa]
MTISPSILCWHKYIKELTQQLKKLHDDYGSKMEQLQLEHKKGLKKQKNYGLLRSKQRGNNGWNKKPKQSTKNKRDVQTKEDEKLAALREQKETLLVQQEKREEFWREKYQSGLENEINALKDSFNAQKLKWESEWADKLSELEKNIKCVEEVEFLISKEQEKIRQLEQSHKKELEQLESRHINILECSGRRHELEIQNLKQVQKIESEEWKSIIQKQLNGEMQDKLAKFKEALEIQQKKEIDTIIDKFTTENETAIKLIQEKHVESIRQLETELSSKNKQLNEWCQKNQTQFEEKQGLRQENTTMKAKLSDCEDMIKKLNSQIDELNLDKQKTQERSEAQFLDKDKKFGEQLAQYKQKQEILEKTIQMNQKAYEHQIKQVMAEHSSELEHLESRIKQTLCKKDDLIMQLKDNIQDKEMRIVEIEKILEQQRNELFAQLS